ncbi:MAG TPA: exonuclease domain-containing protein [Burkholderiaceae bacterium]|nr:exonuclease domain-containing protein [Burkholderiaceae bacterium]HQR71681.1 exonuclease domain-containing protein [Burkholderiaceae bacterium]
MFPVFAPRLAFIDVETTGSNPERERVTEVGLVGVDFDGDAVRVTEWSSLLNPGVPIPPEIQWLTGITNDMVRGAPTFADIASDLYDRLDGAVFVAHNARFDYGFLRAEFTRAGLNFHAKTLCTVRLSRHLYPDRAPHTLDAIIERFGLGGEQRHRALGDARVLWRLLQALAERHPPAELELAIATLLRRPSLPPHLPPDALDGIPHAPGVYQFYGLNGHPIYIGKSVDLKARVAGHFSSEHRAARELRLSQEVHRLEWEETAGELGALLRESELIKTRLPAHNVARRRKQNQVMLRIGKDGLAYLKAESVPSDAFGDVYGPFGSRASARRMLAALASEHGLCMKMLGLEGRRRDAAGTPCFNHQLHRCRGACIGAEPRDEHAARLRELIASWRIPPWPHAGPIALIERNPARFREQIHVFDQWCWLGSVATLDAAEALARGATRIFEADAARLALQALEGRLEVECVGLALPQADRAAAAA